LVPAERIVAFLHAVCRLQPLEVARLFIMVQDDLLIEFVQFSHKSVVGGWWLAPGGWRFILANHQAPTTNRR
jgi:hypothetical protein